MLLGSFAAGLVLVTGCADGETVTTDSSLPKSPTEPNKPTPQSGTLSVPGAELYYEVWGAGPTLLMIPGGLGDASFYSGVAPALAEHYRVVTYDRRGNSRSKLTGPATGLRVSEQADDARRVIAAIGPEPAYVFGSSGGAIIALELVTRAPDRVRTVIVHEPPVVTLLPDAAQRRAQFQAAYDTYRRDGAQQGIREFIAITGLDSASGTEPDTQADPDAGRRFSANIGFFLEHEMLPFIDYAPDIPAVRTRATTTVIARGSASSGQIANLTATVLADRTGTTITDLPGGHTGYLSHAKDFGDQLLGVLKAG